MWAWAEKQDGPPLLCSFRFSHQEEHMLPAATRPPSGSDFTGPVPTLYLAFELGNREWKLGCTTGFGQPPRERTIAARDLTALATEISGARQRFGLAADARVRSCDEAGGDGFWLHRALPQQGVANLVVDSSSIEINRRARRAKSDRLDVRKLLTMLLRYDAGETRVWHVVHVPTPAEEDRRQLHRELLFTKRDRARLTNRIKGLLAGQGVPLVTLQRFTAQLPELRTWDGTRLAPAPPAGLQRECAMAIEIAWAWLRFQPDSALARWYTARFGHGSSRVRRIGIVALARKLLIALWRYLETGVVPEGAVLKG